MRQERYIQVVFNDLEPEGKAVGYYDGRVVFAYGVLPGEEAIIKLLKDKKDIILGVATEIIKASPHRVPAKETHYLSCSPWQILEYSEQCRYKEKNIIDVYYRFAKESVALTKFFQSPQTFNYRTKIEFSFWEEEGILHLAFHERGSQCYKLIADDGCVLASAKMNAVAMHIVEQLNLLKIDRRQVKTITVRESKSNGHCLAMLAVTEKNFPKIEIPDGLLSGFIVAYSNPKSPTSFIDEIIYQTGEDFLDEQILDTKIRYGHDRFFQNNIFLFEEVIKIMRASLNPGSYIVELYAGTGSIGLCLAPAAASVYASESEAESVKYANLNAEINNLKNYEAQHFLAEKDVCAVERLKSADVLVLDPPRVGLHPDVIATIRESQPETILYLSCNPVTQARDFSLLKDIYRLDNLYGFDFYPNTPHVECLAIWRRLKINNV